MFLTPQQRNKLDPSPDLQFYDYPRFVTHVDDDFIRELTTLYQQRLAPGSKILDLMSSWVSHLPSDVSYGYVEGHGMNGEELGKNPQLDHYFIQDLNLEPSLPLKDGEFNAVLICVSVQYLQYPDRVFGELARILKPGGQVIVSFSNRMFAQKAIAAWRDNSDRGRVELVKNYFRITEQFTEPEVIAKPSNLPPFMQMLTMLGVSGKDPFYAVIGQKK